MATVSINIVVWNEMRFLPPLLETITSQTFRDFCIRVIDNGSTDGVETFLREHYPEVTLIRNARNLGFSTAHNQGIRYALEHWDGDLSDRFVLVTNPDTLWTPTFLEELMNVARAHPSVGSIGGKLLRAFGENIGDEVFEQTVRSDRIDSTGLAARRSGTVADRGAGELDTGAYDAQQDVFGISGALALYRASALNQAKIGDEFFDNDFFAYKEDVDLAWRLQRLGWDARYVPSAVAYHYRGMYGAQKAGLWQRIKNRRSKSAVRNYYSTRNHWLTLLKNLTIADAIVFGFWILPYEVARFVFVGLFESAGRRAVIDVIRLMPSMLRKRYVTLPRATRRGSEVRRWFR